MRFIKKWFLVFGVTFVLLITLVIQVWWLGTITSGKLDDANFKLEVSSTSDGDFIVKVIGIRPDALGVLAIEVVLEYGEGKNTTVREASEYYGFDPFQSDVDIILIDYDWDTKLSMDDTFFIRSKDNGGLAKVGDEFSLRMKTDKQEFGNIELRPEATTDNISNKLLKWNFNQISDNITVNRNQSALDHILIPSGAVGRFFCEFQWSNQANISTSVIEDNLINKSITTKVEIIEDIIRVEWDIEYPQRGYQIRLDDVRFITYALNITNEDSNETLILARTTVRLVRLQGICCPSFFPPSPPPSCYSVSC